MWLEWGRELGGVYRKTETRRAPDLSQRKITIKAPGDDYLAEGGGRRRGGRNINPHNEVWVE